MVNRKQLSDIANVMRQDVLKMTTAVGSGHPTSCMSCAEIMSCLFFDEMKYEVSNPNNPDNDEFILSKGHAAPILYSSLFRAGAIKNDLMKLRKLNSPLEGHPIPRSLKWVKVATGSLGQGLSAGVGMALAGKMQRRKFMTYVLMGDSEMAEGSIYEALQLATYYSLNNLCAIIDVNRLGQRGETMIGHNLKKYKKRIESFGWKVEIIDGHDVRAISKTLGRARNSKNPTAIIARTLKGKGVSFLENREDWHGKALKKEELVGALREIPDVKFPRVKIRKPEKIRVKKSKKERFRFNDYLKGELVATRAAYGKVLANIAKSNSKLIAIDGETSNSTKSGEVKKVRPAQFIEAFIAEQNMVGMCLGLSKKGFDVFGSTFSAFLTRAHDQIRMSSLSSGKFTLIGSHAGVSIGEDGASQMGLEDIAMFRALPESSVFYPADAVSTERIVRNVSGLKGLKYIRTTRGKTPVIYSAKETFPAGDFKVLKSAEGDNVVLVGSGITLHECLKASEKLEKCAVVDLYSVKPFNSKKFISFVKKHGRKIVVAEDHYRAGGIGEMLSEELNGSGIEIKHLFVSGVPHSGKPEELLKKYKINSGAILRAVKKLV